VRWPGSGGDSGAPGPFQKHRAKPPGRGAPLGFGRGGRGGGGGGFVFKWREPDAQRAAPTLLDRNPLRGKGTNGTKVRVAGKAAEALATKGLSAGVKDGSKACVRLGGARQRPAGCYGKVAVASRRREVTE
jgi:hypothetical protein